MLSATKNSLRKFVASHNTIRAGALLALLTCSACAPNLAKIVSDGGFIYTDPPTSYNVIGSIMIVQRSLETGRNVLTSVCPNSLYEEGISNGSIINSNGLEREIIRKIGTNSTIDVTPDPAILGQLLTGTGFSGSVNTLKKSELRITNVNYFTSSPNYVYSIAEKIGATTQCGTTNDFDMLEFYRTNGIRTYYVYHTLKADVSVVHTFDSDASVDVKANIEKIVNASLKARGVLNSVDSTTGSGINIGYRLFDPKCPGTRFDKIPTESEQTVCK